MALEVDKFIRCNTSWALLPDEVRANLGEREIEYSKLVKSFSIRCQLRWKDNLVHHTYKDERAYYSQMTDYCMRSLMLFPYHLADVMSGLRITPFIYYCNMVKNIMNSDKSYDSLPNFTAVDCLRILGIGRNQYIDLMNQSRLGRGTGFQKMFKKRPFDELLPKIPLEIKVECWWLVQVGMVTEDDVRRCLDNEREMIDLLIDNRAKPAGQLDMHLLKKLYCRGLIFFDVPISSDDTVSLLPLDNFVMNRTLGDEIETLIYKVFQVLDKATTMKDLATMIDAEITTVTNIVSLMCRLGFCVKHNIDKDNLHPSWTNVKRSPSIVHGKAGDAPLMKEVIDFENLDSLTDIIENSQSLPSSEAPDLTEMMQPLMEELEKPDSISRPKIGIVFDSTLTAFLMMGNLTSGLKTHAVTMFEVGKLSDESMDSFITELAKINLNLEEQEGEAQRYFDHAQFLRETLHSLRNNAQIKLPIEDSTSNVGPGIDLLRCESLLSLEESLCHRLMQKNYCALISVAPLSQEVQTISSIEPYHIGPFIPEFNSPWFKLFLYDKVGIGPPSLLLCKGFRLRQLPVVFHSYEKLLITCWGHDPMVVSTVSCLIMLNDALCNMPVLIQAHMPYSSTNEETIHFPFPFLNSDLVKTSWLQQFYEKLVNNFDVENGFGFVTFSRAAKIQDKSSDDKEINELSSQDVNLYLNDWLDKEYLDDTDDQFLWNILDLNYGIPLFQSDLNEAVCATIISTDILSRERQDKFLENNRKTALQLLEFMSHCRGVDTQFGSNVDKHVAARAPVAMPTNNIMFDGYSTFIWKTNDQNI